ncbi:MAG TPA: hypothetical protein VLB00_14530 [Gemmatimonadales bacterium]|nr:hypothetical protein [Gemmatimonadales bacterium]
MLACLLLALQAVSLDDPAWTYAPAAASRVTDHLGRRALVIASGRAARPDIRFVDGTVEFDLAVSGGRAFAYLQLRMTSDTAYEEVYFRPHKNGLPDAVQYAPVHQGISAWQFHHGPGGTAAAEFERGGWTHVRIEVQGPSLAVFVGNASAPQLVVPRLARAPAEGYLALRNFLPAGVDPERHATGFANLVVKPGVVSWDFSKLPPASPVAPGTILRWEVTPAFAPDSGPVRMLPARQMRDWRSVPADGRGLVNFAEHLLIPDGMRRWATLARLRLSSPGEQTVRLALGFSDEVTVFLNGRPIMSSDQRYSFDNPRQEGVIGFHQATVYLPLLAGANELILVVSDGFGGWGVMGRLEDAAGVRVRP